ncbi:hypothetical protein Btru_068316 [Bulinus truncatus]|nr:hypothetical protein Btru_068316 [Bulinus truncatus]
MGQCDQQLQTAPIYYSRGSLESHRATFQAIIVTDGLTSYLKFIFSIPSFDRVIGNTGKYGTWLAQIGEIVNVEQLCENFIIDNQQIISDATFQTHITDVISMIGCPCSVRWMGGLWSLQYVDNTTRCFALNSLATRLFDHPHSKLCCYHFTPSIIKQYPMTFISTPPDAGFFTFYDPNPWSATYRESNLNDASYILTAGAVKMPTPPDCASCFILLAQQRATNSVGSEATNGTVYSALAAKEKNSSFQVELSSSKDRLTIYCNGQDYTAAFYADPMFSKMIESSIFLERKDEEDLATLHITFSSGIEIAVAQGVHSRDFEVTMPTSLRGLTSGLLGNFNSKLNDEFQLPNGNILSANLTEKEIYYQFASLWSVTAENTVFIYPAGQSSATFQHPEFAPLFFSDLNATVMKSAQEICGHENVACLFDYAATSDPIFAINTKKLDESNDQARIIQLNSLPSLVLVTSKTSLGLVEVTEGQVALMSVSALDPDGNFDRYELIDRPKGVVLNQSGVITFTPSASNPVSISVVAVDQLGGRSSLLNIPLVMCTLCNGHGHCDKSHVRSSVMLLGGRFQKYVCQCRPAYTGDDCEEDWDACSENPCSLGQTCTDTPAAIHDADNSSSHTCGPCPSGTQKVNKSCTDRDECQSSPCSQLCTNVQGSYFCSCSGGYRLNPVDGKTCQDINECTERTHSCEHVCTNSPGTYNCSCLPGYSLQPDSHSCKPSLDSSICSTFACSQICVVDSDNKPRCSCKSFYQIDPQNSTNCIDVNECFLEILHVARCVPTLMEDLNALCYAGYKLSQDLTTCIACEGSSYGTNCSENCLCAHANFCHPVTGCICHKGWTGARCDVNINECVTQENICSYNEVCHDLLGSYECRCRDGFTQTDGGCVDVDECGDIFLHTCELFKNQECHNTIGSFVCDCLPGYTKSSSGQCTDIDECSLHSHSCQQLCINTLGHYTCACHYGLRLDDFDRTKCVVSDNVCKNDIGLNCSHGCTVDLKTKAPFCYCLAEYSLE